MKKFAFLFLIPFYAFENGFTQINQVPVISNFSGNFDQTGAGTFTFDVYDAENDPLELILEVSGDGGNTYLLSALNWIPFGDIGYPITPGVGKKIFFPANQPITLPSGQIRVRLTALDRKPLDFAALVAQVDSNRLKARLNEIEGIRHRTAGPLHLASTQDTIKHNFDLLKLGRNDQSFAFGAYMGQNIIGNKTGLSKSGQTVIIDAHYDTVNNSPGADDNGSGTVGMLEIATILSPYPSRKGMRYIGFDLEESGLIGSQRYVQALPATDTILGVFNFEMIGYYNDTVNSQVLPTGFNLAFPAAYNAVAQDSFRGNFITNVGNVASQDLINRFYAAAQTYVPDLKVINVAAPGNGSQTPDLTRSDHAPFWVAGKKALMITDGANFRNECYHTPEDKSYKLNFTFMQQVTQATLAAAAQLAEIEHGSWSVISPDLVLSTETKEDDCETQIWRNGQELQIKLNGCTKRIEEAAIQIFSIDGAEIFTQKVDLHPNNPTTLHTQLVQLNHYFVVIINQSGQIIAKQKI